ncbi:MAG: GNAT family N-acetyltransferase [Patescibacteria group bacterium]
MKIEKVVIRQIDPKSRRDAAAIARWAWLLDNVSWGTPQDPYPKRGMEEIPHALVAFGAFVGNKLVGAACITDHHSSPDGQDRDAMYFALAVVDPKYRRRGIWERLYVHRLEWVSNRPGRVIATGENLSGMRMMCDRGWKPYRMGRNEKGDSFIALELPRR